LPFDNTDAHLLKRLLEVLGDSPFDRTAVFIDFGRLKALGEMFQQGLVMLLGKVRCVECIGKDLEEGLCRLLCKCMLQGSLLGKTPPGSEGGHTVLKEQGQQYEQKDSARFIVQFIGQN
jgi:hypothetical protein